MFKKALILFYFISINCQSQNYAVVYDLEQVEKITMLKSNIKTYLNGNQNFSVYVEDWQNSYDTGNSNDIVIKMPFNENPTYYKDIRKNTTIYNDDIKFNFFNIKDSIGAFNWKIEMETKKILNYNCQKASLNFRGRDFVVYFTSDISASNGPLKFTGLPGLILEVISNDAVASFHYVAQSIKLSDSKTEVKNIYADKKVITYDEFAEIYRKKYKESLTKIVNTQGETRPLSKGFMEKMIYN